MKGELIPLIKPLEDILSLSDFKLIHNDDFRIKFKNKSNWQVYLGTELYYDGYSRVLISPDGYNYSIFLLIKVYKQLTGEEYQLVERFDWAQFISSKIQWLMDNESIYKDEYKKLDTYNT